jgi:hypothetical protein
LDTGTLTPVPLINSTDKLFTSAYLTEVFYLSGATKCSTLPTQMPFNFAFGTEKGVLGGWWKGRAMMLVGFVRRKKGGMWEDRDERRVFG